MNEMKIIITYGSNKAELIFEYQNRNFITPKIKPVNLKELISSQNE